MGLSVEQRILLGSVVDRGTRHTLAGRRISQLVCMVQEAPLASFLHYFSIRVTHFLWVLALFGLLLQSLSSSITQAQVTTAITSDGTLGTQVTQNGNIHDITGGARPGEGPNLFHSFGQFSVGASDTANFLNNTGAPTTNILGRVSGGQVSNIFGTIQTTGFPGANLFLVNPAGMVFGPNATLNVSGAVHFTTADFLQLADRVRFNAMPGPSDALLTSAPVEAFGFLNGNPAGITLDRSSLKVPEGETLSLVGGDITIVGNPDQPPDETIPSLAAESGRVNLVSVASAGEMEVNAPDNDPDFRFNSFERLGEITLSKAASVDTSGDGGGTVVIRSGRLTIDESRISANTTGPAEGPLEGQSGTGIDIQVVEDLLLDNGSIVETNVFANVTEGIGSGGVRVSAGNVEIMNQSMMDSHNNSENMGGKSGDITVQANSMKMYRGFIRAFTTDMGDGGNINVQVNEGLEMQNNSQIITLSFLGGKAGDIEAQADTVKMIGTVDTFPAITSAIGPASLTEGRAGNIRMSANSLEMDKAFISTPTFGAGQAGNIDVNVEGGNVFISGPGGILTNTLGSGQGGELQVTAHNLILTNRASLQAATDGSGAAGGATVMLTGNLELQERSFIQVRSANTGDAADLSITAKDIVITGISEGTDPEVSDLTGLSTNTATDGQGGNLNIEAENLTVSDKGFIAAATTGSGDSGNVSINLAGKLELFNGGQIFANTNNSGNAGTIDVRADNIVLSGVNPILFTRRSDGMILPAQSAIRSQSQGGSGKAGDIQVTAQRLSVLDGALIDSQSLGPADAGNIDLRANDSILISNGAVTTEARMASGGNITFMAPNIIRLSNSQVTSSVMGGSETAGGNITIDPVFTVLDRGSSILANAREGRGGNIRITTDFLFQSPDSVIDASSDLGVSGSVEVDSPDTDVIAGTLELPESFLNLTTLIGERCAGRSTQGTSSFIVSGRGGVSPGPETILPGYMWLSDIQESSSTAGVDKPTLATPMVNSLTIGCSGN